MTLGHHVAPLLGGQMTLGHYVAPTLLTCDAPKPGGPLTTRQPAEYKWRSEIVH